MRYIFKPKSQESDICVEAVSDGLSIQKDDTQIDIPYNEIKRVKLEKYYSEFFLDIDAGQLGSYQINNATFSRENTRIDKSRQYHTFVRIFHYHLLKNQSSAIFVIQIQQSDFGVKFLILISLFFLLYFFEDYTNFLPFSPFTITITLLLLGMLFLLIPYFLKRPRSYHPSDIPLDMLPPVN